MSYRVGLVPRGVSPKRSGSSAAPARSGASIKTPRRTTRQIRFQASPALRAEFEAFPLGVRKTDRWSAEKQSIDGVSIFTLSAPQHPGAVLTLALFPNEALLRFQSEGTETKAGAALRIFLSFAISDAIDEIPLLRRLTDQLG